MIFHCFTYPDLALNSYLVGDRTSKQCIVIDPPRIIHPIVEYIKERQLTLKAILETHVHADFVSGALELRHAYDDPPAIYCSKAGGPQWVPHYADRIVDSGTEINLGEIRLVALYTPGHTPEHVSWICYDTSYNPSEPYCAFTGDFLLVDAVGRPDLLGSGMTENLLQLMHESLFRRLDHLPNALRIFPAHGSGSLCSKSNSLRTESTLGQERKQNPGFSSLDDFSVWKAQLLKDIPVAPIRFEKIKKLNIKSVPILQFLPKVGFNPSEEEMDKLMKTGWTVDFREPNAFAKDHLLDAVNVPLAPSMGNWLAAVLPDHLPILCVVDHVRESQRIVDLIRMLGVDQPIVIAEWNKIQEMNLPHQRLSLITPHDLNRWLKNERDHTYVIDLRIPAEWNSGHILQAHHIELASLQKQVGAIPRERKVVMVCGSGWRSSIGASLLKREGFADVHHLAGGMHAWQNSGGKVERSD